VVQDDGCICILIHPPARQASAQAGEVIGVLISVITSSFSRPIPDVTMGAHHNSHHPIKLSVPRGLWLTAQAAIPYVTNANEFTPFCVTGFSTNWAMPTTDRPDRPAHFDVRAA
jgi:hypothetical protein